MKILDCTLRDGGYYTQWDFDASTLNAYVAAMNQLPVDYLEVGYRNTPQDEYLGKMGYSPVSVLKYIREVSCKKLAIMLNAKSTSLSDVDALIAPLRGVIDMVRVAVSPAGLEHALELAKEIKQFGFELAFNLMYMSEWTHIEGLYEKLSVTSEDVDILNMVDSYGGVTPAEVKCIYTELRRAVSCSIGFHGHNNLQLGLANTIAAMECGVDSVDSTILGMGRGAGNLNTELLLTYLNKHAGLEVNFNELGKAVSAFMPLMEEYRWGTSLPYMISGANSFPQKEVMSWVCNRMYSFNSIVRALDNRMGEKVDNAQYPNFVPPTKYSCVLVIGGGQSIVTHLEAIRTFLAQHPDSAIIFPTARHAAHFVGEAQQTYYCLVGNEAQRLKENVPSGCYRGTCILPPYPRPMGTEVPDYAEASTRELEKLDFASDFRDSVTAIALQLAILLSDNVYIAGYDGYPGAVLSEKEAAMTNENNVIFEKYREYSGLRLLSLTPTIYKTVEVESIYQIIQ